MTPEELKKRQERAEREALVIKRTDDGYQVHAPAGSARTYLVSGNLDSPSCTCPDFTGHSTDPEWRCKHILAVIARMMNGNGLPTRGESDRRVSSQAAMRNAPGTPEGNSGARMLLKRSVSPDGRIDSFSVEFDADVDSSAEDAIRASAVAAMRLQDQIVEDFLEGKGTEDDPQPTTEAQADRPVPARLVDIGGLNGKWGRRLFINVQANGKPLKLFGNRTELSDHLRMLGRSDLAEHIEEGVELDVPCRVTTKPSPDGRFTNIERVLPCQTRQSQGRPRS